MAGMLFVSRLISVQDLESLVEQGMTYEQISDKLRIKHPLSKGLFSISVRRFCRKVNIGRNCKLNKKELIKAGANAYNISSNIENFAC